MGESDKYPDKLAALVSFIPQVEDKNEMAPAEFIFVLDWSGSMSGDGIAKAKDALKIFLSSLPEGSYFNVLSFGDTFEYMFTESQIYTNEILEEAIEKINKFEGDLGGTELLPPL